MDATPPPSPPPPPLPLQPVHVHKPIGENAGMRLLLPVGRSMWAIIAGYLGLFSLILVFAPGALVCGIVAVQDIRKSRGGLRPKHGMGRAIFGIVMGTLGTIGLIIVITSMFLNR